MGLLDSVLGQVLNSNNGQPGQQQGGGLGGLGGAGLGGIIGVLASNPQLIQIVASMLSNGGAQGGLGGLVGKFEQAGLGSVIGSWIGGGHNQPVSGAQLGQVLGQDTLSNIAAQLGVQPDEAASQLSQVLPGLVDHLTPQGAAPEQGLGDHGDLFGMLGGLLAQK